MRGVGLVIAAAAALLLGAAPAPCEDFGAAAERFARLAEKSGVGRVSVLEFTPRGGAERSEAEYVGELVSHHLAGRKKPALIERSQLEKVLKENKASFQPGTLDEILTVDAVVTGSVFAGAGGKLKVMIRLIDVRSGRVLAAARAEAEREWPDFPEVPQQQLSFDAPPSFSPSRSAVAQAYRPPADLRDSPAGDRGGDCAARGRRLAELNSGLVDEKARYWADRMSAPGFSARNLTRNPGSEIADAATKARFYSLLTSYYRDGGYAPPSGEKQKALQELLREENDVYNDCPRR